MENKSKTIIVTGSNKGIGYGIVEGLAKEGPKWNIIMACRNLQLANQSHTEITTKYPDAQIQTLELDVSNTESVDKFLETLSHRKIGVDVLVNNAGVAAKGDAFDDEVVRNTFATNFFGTVYLSEKIVPLMNKNGKIIIVGSMVGKFSRIIKSEELLQRWKKQDLTRADLFDNVNHFIDSVKNDNYATVGYAKSAYGTSKLAINLFARVHGKSQGVLDKHLQVYTLCPGYVNTDMTSHKGHLTLEQGAETPLFLIHQPFDINPKYQGQFFQKSALSSLD